MMNIGIVNDMPLAVEALRRAILLRPAWRVCWVAGNGEEAVAMCAWQTPNLILMDLVMPGLDGVEATRRIMARTPCPILIVTADIGENAGRVYEALGGGALDVIATPTLAGGDLPRLAAPLLDKIELLSRRLVMPIAPAPAPAPVAGTARAGGGCQSALVAIGASAGGPAAVAEVLRALPADFPAAVVIIQHIDAAFSAGMAYWLDEQSPLEVRLAEEGAALLPGRVWIADGRANLTLGADGLLHYARTPGTTAYQPSVDVFFHSVAQHWRRGAIGVLLSGMGNDGAAGLKALLDRGFPTIAQDRATCAVYGMPKAAAALGAAASVLPVHQIAPALRAACAPRGRGPTLEDVSK